jgi:hypothetical protein
MNPKLLGGVSAFALGTAMLAAPAVLQAQQAQGVSTTQSASHADSAQFFVQNVGGRTTCTTTQDTAANLTINIVPPAGNYVYLTGLYITGASNATAASSATVWSSTNLNGSPAWLTNFTASSASVPTGDLIVAEVYPTAIKSTVAGTAVTIVPQATSASAFLCAHAVGYFNPT